MIILCITSSFLFISPFAESIPFRETVLKKVIVTITTLIWKWWAIISDLFPKHRLILVHNGRDSTAVWIQEGRDLWEGVMDPRGCNLSCFSFILVYFFSLWWITLTNFQKGNQPCLFEVIPLAFYLLYFFLLKIFVPVEYGALIFFNFWVWLVSSLCWLYRLSIPSTSVSWKRSLGIGILSSCSMEFTSEVYGPGVYFMERFLTTN